MHATMRCLSEGCTTSICSLYHAILEENNDTTRVIAAWSSIFVHSNSQSNQATLHPSVCFLVRSHSVDGNVAELRLGAQVLYGVNQRLRVEDVDSPLVNVRPVKTILLVAISGDRGLCGGYNNFLIKKVCSVSPASPKPYPHYPRLQSLPMSAAGPANVQCLMSTFLHMTCLKSDDQTASSPWDVSCSHLQTDLGTSA